MTIPLLKLKEMPYKSLDESFPKIWKDLQSQGKYTSPFMSYEWFHSLHLAFGSECPFQTYLLIEHVDTGKVVALIPVAWRKVKLFSGFTVDGLFIMHSEPCYPDHLDLLALPDWRKEVILELLQWIKKQKADAWIFRSFTESSPSLGMIQNAFVSSGYFHREADYPCPYFQFPPADQLKPWLKKRFERMMTVRRKLEREHKVTKGIVRTQEEFDRVFQSYVDLHKGRWGEKSTVTTFQQAINQLRIFCEKSLHLGTLRIFYLEIMNRVVAVDVGLCHDQTFYTYQSAFDEDYKRYSLGAVKNILMVEQAIEDGLTHWDLLRGNHPYKTTWSTGVAFGQNAVIFPKTLSGFFHHVLYSSVMRLKVFLKWVLRKKNRE